MRDSFRTLSDDADGRLIAVRVRLTGTASVHPTLVARRTQIAENAQSALHHVFEDAWLEKFLVESQEPVAEAPVEPSALASIDTNALLAGLEADPEMRAAAERLIDDIGDQWPSSPDFSKADLIADLDHLMDEARTLVLARASGKAVAPAAEE
jgi:hypothetical protein